MTITLSTYELREILEQIRLQTPPRTKPANKAYKVLIQTPKFPPTRKRNGNGNGWKSDRN